MIPRDFITEWRSEAPWTSDEQVEQDLVISRAVVEIFKIDDEVRHLINEELTSPQLRRRARELGMRTLREDGIRKVLAGTTSAEEVLRVTMSDSD